MSGYAECCALVVCECGHETFDASVVVFARVPLSPGVDVVCVWLFEHEVEHASAVSGSDGRASVPQVVSVEEDVTGLGVDFDFVRVEFFSQRVFVVVVLACVVERESDAGHAVPDVVVEFRLPGYDARGSSGDAGVVEVDDGGDHFGLVPRGGVEERVVAVVHVHALVEVAGFLPCFGL